MNGEPRDRLIQLGVTCSDAECEALMEEVLALADGRGFGAAASSSGLASAPDAARLAEALAELCAAVVSCDGDTAVVMSYFPDALAEARAALVSGEGTGTP